MAIDEVTHEPALIEKVRQWVVDQAYAEALQISLVMIDTTSIPPVSSTTTSVLTAPGVIVCTLPFKALRALMFISDSLLPSP